MSLHISLHQAPPAGALPGGGGKQ